MFLLARMIYATKPQVTFISEVKSSKIKVDDLIARFNISDSIVVPSRRRSGGLWLMWTDEVQVHVHSFNFHVMLATIVVTSSNLNFDLSVYMVILTTVLLVK